MNPTPAAENPVPQHESYDVLVVGAGPAGTMAARAAASTGARVLLADSAPLPRYKSCGGMLNEYAQRALSAVGELPREAVLEPKWVNFRYYDWDRGSKNPARCAFATWTAACSTAGCSNSCQLGRGVGPCVVCGLHPRR